MNRLRRFARLQEIGCVACLIEGVGYQPCDIHHIVDKGYREHSGGDNATIGLCPWHHRGLIPDQLTKKETEEMLGPSMALQKRAFIKRYGTERELLAIVDEIVNADNLLLH